MAKWSTKYNWVERSNAYDLHIIEKAREVFQTNEDALHWLKSPKIALDNKTPLEYCDTEIGANEVKNLLGRIEHGVF